MAATSHRQDLIASVAQVQNHPAFEHVDILTFCGWGDVSDEDIAKHLEANLAYVARWSETEQVANPRRARRAK